MSEGGERRPRGRPKQVDAARLQEALLKVATSEFLRHGYAGAHMQAIARKARISKVTLYRHFSSKELLFRAVMSNAAQAFNEDLSRIYRRSADRDPEDVLRAFARASYDDPLAPEGRALTRLALAEAESFPEIAYAILLERQQALHPITSYLSDMSARGIIDLKAFDHHIAAVQFYALVTGGVRIFLQSPDRSLQSRDHWIDGAVRVFLDGYRARA